MHPQNDPKEARKYTPRTVKRLTLLSGGTCYRPDCRNPTISIDNSTILGKIAHIRAAAPSGPRFDVLMTDDERRSFENLLFLCGPCHDIIDEMENEELFPPELLFDWKRKQETETKSERLRHSLSNIGQVVHILSQSAPEPELVRPVAAFAVDEKISINGLVTSRPFIEEYAAYSIELLKAYRILEIEKPERRRKITLLIRGKYAEAKGKLGISATGDQLFQKVRDDLEELLKNAQGLEYEDIYYGVSVLVVDAFISCHILEHPQANDPE